MSKVPESPSLPRNFAQKDQQQAKFNGALTIALINYLTLLAARANTTLARDGSEAMEGALDMGGFSISNVADLTGSGGLNFGTLRLTGTGEATLASTTHPFQIGPTAGANLIMDQDEIQTRNNGAAAAMSINPAGGTVTLGGALTIGGLLDLGATGNIQFPATQSASAGANVLDDYEEGTFTPTISGTTSAGAGTYTTQIGIYTKIGRLVAIILNMVWTAHTGTGNMSGGGLPFAAGASYEIPCSVWFQNLTYTTTLLVRINASATTFSLNGNASGAAATAIAMDTAASLYMAGVYFV